MFYNSLQYRLLTEYIYWVANFSKYYIPLLNLLCTTFFEMIKRYKIEIWLQYILLNRKVVVLGKEEHIKYYFCEAVFHYLCIASWISCRKKSWREVEIMALSKALKLVFEHTIIFEWD